MTSEEKGKLVNTGLKVFAVIVVGTAFAMAVWSLTHTPVTDGPEQARPVTSAK